MSGRGGPTLNDDFSLAFTFSIDYNLSYATISTSLNPSVADSRQ
jgi:hypothetical protein